VPGSTPDKNFTCVRRTSTWTRWFKVSGRAERRILCFRILVSRDQERFGRYYLYSLNIEYEKQLQILFFLILKMFLDTGHQNLFCYLRASNCKILCFFGVQNDVHYKFSIGHGTPSKSPIFINTNIKQWFSNLSSNQVTWQTMLSRLNLKTP
jgi:hypothetical protein